MSGSTFVETARRAAHAVEVRASRAERAMHRRFLAVGDRVECPVCGWSGIAFAASRKPRRINRLCPQCSSTERDRALHLWLADRRADRGARLLEVAPLGLVEDTARRLGFTYTSMDLSSSRARILTDLCALTFRDSSFDVIVCFHVLEHVPSDAEAVAELARVLREGGTAIISVPWDGSEATTDEDLDAPAEERLRRFGQSDHVRMYGRDVVARLGTGGLEVEEVLWRDLFSPRDFRRCALDGDDDRFWICRSVG